MGSLRDVCPVMLFCGILFNDESVYMKTRQKLESLYGPVCVASDPIEFTFTQYYDKEMGSNIKRLFLAFENLISPGDISQIKLDTNEIENFHMLSNQRSINIDPGYISNAKVVLATTKDYAHRLYLKEGIYGEITLGWRNKEYHDFPWTYPDYKSEYAQDFFRNIRARYRDKIKGKSGPGTW